MFKYAYDTTPCADYVLGNIKKEVELAYIDGELLPAKSVDGQTLPHVLTISPATKRIDPFAHPLTLVRHGVEMQVIDTRGMTRLSREGDITIASRIDYTLLLLRAGLTEQWVSHSPLDLLACGTLPLTVFSRWVSEAICRRLPINPGDQLKITVIAGWFYLSMFRDPANNDEQTRLKMATQIGRATYVNVEKVLEITDGLTIMADVRDFVDQLKAAIGSSALEKFSHALLYTFIGGSWFGPNAKEVVAVALEHPPTFIAMVFVALQDRSWRNTRIGELTLQNDKGDAGRSFSYNLLSLLKA